MIYKITVKNWEKYNGKKGKHNGCTNISVGFLNDAKIQMLPKSGILLYLGLLLKCGENRSSKIEASHEVIVRLAGGSGVVVSRLMRQFTELQLLTYEIQEINNSAQKKTKKTAEIVEPKNIVSVSAIAREKEDDMELKLKQITKKIKDLGPIEPLKGDSRIESMLRCVNKETQNAWIDTYVGIDFVLEELKKANVWILANPKKAPRDFGRFFSNWLSRAHERYRKGLPSRRQTHSEMNAQVAQELWKKNEEGLL